MNISCLRTLCGAIALSLTVTTADANCKKWFEHAKLSPIKDCLVKCAVLRVDLATFMCPSSCDELCNSSQAESWIFQLSDLYPGLTYQERALAAQHPLKILRAYQLSWKTEELCLTLYPTSKTNDESDACRHFVWASLLYQEFGPSFSSQILAAHEEDPEQPDREKAMDLANNRLGQLSTSQLVKAKQFSESALLASFEENLKRGKLITIKGKGKK